MVVAICSFSILAVWFIYHICNRLAIMVMRQLTGTRHPVGSSSHWPSYTSPVAQTNVPGPPRKSRRKDEASNMVHFTEKIWIGKARKYETSSFLNRVHLIFSLHPVLGAKVCWYILNSTPDYGNQHDVKMQWKKLCACRLTPRTATGQV